MFVRKKKYLDLKRYYDNELDDCYHKIEELRSKLLDVKNKSVKNDCLNILNKKLKLNYELIGLEYNKDNDLVAVMWDYSTHALFNSYFEIKLYFLNKNDGMFRTPYCCFRKSGDNNIFIVDLISYHEFSGVGNASIILKYLKLKFKELGFNFIGSVAKF